MRMRIQQVCLSRSAQGLIAKERKVIPDPIDDRKFHE